MRFRNRHVQQTLADHVETRLTELGWVNDPVNFGTTGFTFLDAVPGESREPDVPNTAVLSLGNEGPREEAELGGLREIAWPVFVDIWGESPGIAALVASDVKDILSDLQMPVTDYVPAVPVATDEWLEVEDLSIERPQRASSASEWKRNLRTVKGMVIVYFLVEAPA